MCEIGLADFRRGGRLGFGWKVNGCDWDNAFDRNNDLQSG